MLATKTDLLRWAIETLQSEKVDNERMIAMLEKRNGDIIQTIKDKERQIRIEECRNAL